MTYRPAATTNAAQERVSTRARKARDLIRSAAVLLDEIDQIVDAEGVTGGRREDERKDTADLIHELNRQANDAFTTGICASTMIYNHRGSDAPVTA